MAKPAAARTSAQKEPLIRLNAKQKQLLALLIGAVIVMSAGLILISTPSTQVSAQLNNCATMQPAQKYYCVLAVANQTGNVSYCSDLSGSYAQECVSAYASKQNNTVSCNLLNHNSSLYQQCLYSYAIENGNATACSGLSGSQEYMCIINISAKGGFSNPGACSNLKNLSQQNDCSSAFSFKGAIASQNSAYCSSLGNQTDVNETYALSQAYAPSQGSVGYALSLSPESFCYYSMASATGNLMLCNNIPQQQAGGCYSLVGNAISSQRPTYSYNFNASTPQAACSVNGPLSSTLCYAEYYTVQARDKGNYTECQNEQNATYGNYCIDAVAVRWGKPADCAFITNATLQSSCVQSANAIAAYNYQFNFSKITQTTTSIDVNTTSTS